MTEPTQRTHEHASDEIMIQCDMDISTSICDETAKHINVNMEENGQIDQHVIKINEPQQLDDMINSDTDNIAEDQHEIETKQSELQHEIETKQSELQHEIHTMKSQLVGMINSDKDKIADLQHEIDTMKSQLEDMISSDKDKVAEHQHEIETIKSELQHEIDNIKSERLKALDGDEDNVAELQLEIDTMKSQLECMINIDTNKVAELQHDQLKSEKDDTVMKRKLTVEVF